MKVANLIKRAGVALPSVSQLQRSKLSPEQSSPSEASRYVRPSNVPLSGTVGSRTSLEFLDALKAAPLLTLFDRLAKRSPKSQVERALPQPVTETPIFENEKQKALSCLRDLIGQTKTRREKRLFSSAEQLAAFIKTREQSKVNYGSWFGDANTQCDYKRLADDLAGRSRYCASSDDEGTLAQEPFRDLNCQSDDSSSSSDALAIVPSDPSDLFSVSGSLERRGTVLTSDQKLRCDRLIEYNSEGLRKHNIIRSIGTSAKIELAPRVKQVTLSDESEKELKFSFTSPIHQSSPGSITVDDTHCRVSEGNAVVGIDQANPLEYSVRLSAKLPLYSQSAWNSLNSDWLEQEYGHSKLNWPNYLSVKITDAKARNGISLVGNKFSDEQEQRWLYGGDALSGFYLLHSGIIQRGNDEFEIRIPCRASHVCCGSGSNGGCGNFNTDNPLDCEDNDLNLHRWSQVASSEPASCPDNSVGAKYYVRYIKFPTDQNEPRRCCVVNTCEPVPPTPKPTSPPNPTPTPSPTPEPTPNPTIKPEPPQPTPTNHPFDNDYNRP